MINFILTSYLLHYFKYCEIHKKIYLAVIKEMQIKLHYDSNSPKSQWQSSRKQTTNVGKDERKRNLYTLLVGMQTSVSILEIRVSSKN
jgi:hypothetical protein